MVWVLSYFLIGFALNWWTTRISKVFADQHWVEDAAAILFWPLVAIIMAVVALEPTWRRYR